jgi:AcrR family transcriptional regulator
MTKREQEIVAAAAQVFKDKGYHAATTRDIAAAVGIQQASLYYYVSSKEELLYLVVREPIMQLYAQVEEIVKANVPVRHKIERCLQAHLAAFDDNYPHMFVFVQELHNVVQVLQDKLRDLPRRYQRLWEDMLMILGMCNWMSRWYRKGGRLDTAALARQYASAILDGLVTRAVPD